MAYIANKNTFKHAAYILLLISMMAASWHVIFSKTKPVHAENLNAGKITKERLDTFYDLSVDMQLEGEMEAVSFYEKRLHKEYEGVTHVSMRVDNELRQKETIVLTKYEYLRSIKKAYKVSSFEELQSGIVSYDISEDGRSAKVNDRTYLLSTIPQTETESFNLRQFVICDQFYVLNEDNVLQLKSGTCQVEGIMNKERAL